MPGWLEERKLKNGKTAFIARWREGDKKVARYLGALSRRDAERALQVIGRDLLLAPFGLGTRENLTLAAFVRDRWLPKRDVRPNTHRRDVGLLNQHILPALGNLELWQITVERVDDFLADLKREVSPHTAKRALAVLRRALNDAKRYRLVAENPAALASVEITKRPLKVLSVDAVASAIAAVRPDLRHIPFFAALTGLRWGEQAALTWGDIDIDPAIARVTKQAPANFIGVVSEPKSLAGNRIVDLLPPVRDMLMDLGLPELPTDGALMFPGVRGGYLNYRWFQQNVWKKAAPGIRWHDLRHFFASLLIAFGHDYLYVARQLGHSSPTVTLDVYSHLFEEQKRGKKLDQTAVLAKLTGALRGTPEGVKVA